MRTPGRRWARLSSAQRLLATVAALLVLALAPPAASAATWTFAASEWNRFTLAGTSTVRFGAEPRWIEKSASGTVACTGDFFGGDPAPGVVKACYVSSDVAWVFLADEGLNFSVSGPHNVRFGVEPHWVTKVVSGTAPCTTAYFGADPAFGFPKKCYTSGDAAAPSGWSGMATEGESFGVIGTQTVRYGAEPRWLTKVVSGTVQCTNEFFGSDPAPGVFKQCEQQGGGGTTTPPSPSGNPPPGNQPPLARIDTPAAGTTFRAGQNFWFSGGATDREDGIEPNSRLTWWVDLHHDTHTHPFVQPTTGSSGTVSIPTRNETSDNIWYRFHLRATDSQGATHEVTRDILPQKSRFTLTTSPAGLQLTLDGQPLTAPGTVTGVIGVERLLGAADQNFNGRRWRFSTWSDGGAASHTIGTPAANTTYIATFTDAGPAGNMPPSVALSAPATGVRGAPMALSASASDTDGTILKVEFFDGGNKIGEDTASPYNLSWTPATTGVHTLTARATDNGGASTTSGVRSVTVSEPTGGDTTPPSIALSVPANLSQNLLGTITITAGAFDNVAVQSVEFQVDGVPVGTADTTAPYSVTYDTNRLASGQHVIRARARDTSGNQSGWATSLVTFGGSRNAPQGFTRVDTWVSGLANATAMAQAPDGRIFVAEQAGRLRVVKNGVLLPTPFATLPVNTEGERGLVGVAIDPNFASNGYVYVYYTTPQNGVHNRVSRFVASGDVAAAGPGEMVLFDLPLLGTLMHNGGAMHFGIDGKLYVAVGENGNPPLALDLNSPLGKMLRFNADGSIPTDNPFYGTRSGLARAIWAYGLRNPFTFAIQPGTGRMHINDVGQNTWEEINLGAPGANFGWPGSEGPMGVINNVTGPLFTYRHTAASPAGSGLGGFIVGQCIAGGAFYPSGGPFPAPYRGNYFFADYVAGFVALLDMANGNAAYTFASGFQSPVNVMVGTDGALYVLTRATIARITAP